MAKKDNIKQSSDVNALYELNKSKDAGDLILHHRYVKEYYSEYNNNREVNHNFVRGFHYDGDEVRKYRDKRKTPIVFNQVKTSERTIIGMFLQNRYDIKFSATTPTDDDLAEILEQLDTWEQNQQGDDMNDMELMRQAWAGGNSFQECFMDIQDGKEPTMRTKQQNPFAIYWDPDSRELITRTDAKFVDRDSWMSYNTLLKIAPKDKDKIESQIGSSKDGDSGYDEVQAFADRDHENKIERNGQYMVTERFYKVDGSIHFAEFDNAKVEIEEEDLKAFKEEYPDVQVQSEDAEILYLAITCEDYSPDTYLFNDKYHCQPRDFNSGEIIWPVLEMVAESLAGEPQGFVDHERGPNKVVNAMMSNIVSSATHASAAAMLSDPTAFISEREAKLAARHHSDSDRTFQVKKGRVHDAMAPVPRAGVTADHQYALDYSLTFLKEVTSTPPSMQGQEEGSGVSGKLNAQRIEQGFTQLQPMMKNYRLFLKQRAKLRYYYWRTYYTAEKTFRIVDKTEPEMNPFATINKLEPETDAVGRFTGGFKKMNDINASMYDINIEESVKSPSYRDKQLTFVSNMMNSGFVQSDPGLAGALLEEALRLSDAPDTTKKFMKEYSNLIQQAEATKRQAEQQLTEAQTESAQLGNMAQMQNIAQTESEQTGIPNAQGAPPAGQPPQPMQAQQVA